MLPAGVNVTTSSAVIRATTTVAWTDNATPSRRLTGGTGTFEPSSRASSETGSHGW